MEPTPERVSSVALLRVGFHMATRQTDLLVCLSLLFGLIMTLASIPIIDGMLAIAAGQTAAGKDAGVEELAGLLKPLIPYFLINMVIAPPLAVIWVRGIRLTPDLALAGGSVKLIERSLNVLAQGLIALGMLVPAMVPIILAAGIFSGLAGANAEQAMTLITLLGLILTFALTNSALSVSVSEISVDRPISLIKVFDKGRRRIGLMVSIGLLAGFAFIILMQGLSALLLFEPITRWRIIGFIVLSETIRAMVSGIIICTAIAARTLILGKDGPAGQN